MTVEERLRRIRGLAAVVQQTSVSIDQETIDNVGDGLFDIMQRVREDVEAIMRALPTETQNLPAPGERASLRESTH